MTAVEAKQEEPSVTVVKDPSVTLSKPEPEPWVDNTEPIIRKDSYTVISATNLCREFSLRVA